MIAGRVAGLLPGDHQGGPEELRVQSDTSCKVEGASLYPVAPWPDRWSLGY